MKVIIAGGGIGGLTAALSLHKVGIDVTVYEAVEQLEPLGVGINILPHASRELIELGLEHEVDRFGIRTTAMNYYTSSGVLAISQPCGLHAGYHWPQWSVHRGKLQMMLLRVFRERAGSDKVVENTKIIGFEQDIHKVKVTLSQGHETVTRTEECDVFIGADGLHSTVRSQLYPNEGRPIYCGMVLYRGTVEAPQYLDGQTMVVIGDKRLRLVSYPISRELQATGQGHSHINWIAALPMTEDEAPREDWTNRAKQQRLTPLYADWHFDWYDVPSTLASTREIFEFPVYDRDPLERWTFGRVTLLGDAAHPLIPVSSSGAVQAIIDGRALAYALATQDDPVAGLQAYEDDRLERANRTVLSSRENGPDEVLEIVAARCRDGEQNIHDIVPLDELQAVIDNFKARTGFHIETLNARPSYNVNA